MTNKALCVGINEFRNLGTNSWLNGCVNDANDMVQAIRPFGFTAGNTTKLLDAEATKTDVMAALTDMVGKAQPGDRLLFSFSSHGTQVPDVPGSEAKGDVEYDNLDEAFACHDIKAGASGWDRDTVIIDDELRELLATLPPGVLLEVLLDTCHSGSGLRDLDQIQHDLLIGRRPRYLPQPSQRGVDRVIELRQSTPTRTVDRKPLVELTKKGKGARPVLFAACKPAQTASDATFGARPNGAFTYLFLRALKEQPDATRADLLKAVTAGLKAERFEQRSTLEATAAAKKVAFGQSW